MEQALTDYETHGTAWAVQNAERKYVERCEEILLAQKMNTHHELPVNQRKVMALADPEYKEFVEGVKQAVSNENMSDVLMTKAKMTFEFLRSKLSLEKAKMEIR